MREPHLVCRGLDGALFVGDQPPRQQSERSVDDVTKCDILLPESSSQRARAEPQGTRDRLHVTAVRRRAVEDVAANALRIRRAGGPLRHALLRASHEGGVKLGVPVDLRGREPLSIEGDTGERLSEPLGALEHPGVLGSIGRGRIVEGHERARVPVEVLHHPVETDHAELCTEAPRAR